MSSGPLLQSQILLAGHIWTPGLFLRPLSESPELHVTAQKLRNAHLPSLHAGSSAGSNKSTESYRKLHQFAPVSCSLASLFCHFGRSATCAFQLLGAQLRRRKLELSRIMHHPLFPSRLHDPRHPGGYLHPPALGENPPDPVGHALGKSDQLASGNGDIR